jgi:hypothetical protein
MAKSHGLARSAREDAELFGVVEDFNGEQIILLHWPKSDAGQLAITQGEDAVVVDKRQAASLIQKLADFIIN